jgi:hypothetical protein
MPLNPSGPISLGGATAGQSIAQEIGLSPTGTISLNQTDVRRLAGIPATNTTIIMPTNFYGKSYRTTINLTISANTYNYDVWANTAANPSYNAGFTDVILTVNPGIFVGGNTPASYAMLVPSAFNAGDSVTIVNNGSILGAGGAGGDGGGAGPTPNDLGRPGAASGNSVYVNRPTTITNNGSIFSGGGGGGGGNGGNAPGGPPFNRTARRSEGGGGGGGAGFNGGAGGAAGVASGGQGADGSPGTTSAGGAGGAGGGGNAIIATAGGPGGGLGAAGTSASPNPLGAAGSGGGTGFYIVGNPFVTWPATGSRGGNVG